jgi:aminopeptidase N
MTEHVPRVIRRQDYRPAAFAIDSADLSFKLGENESFVTAKLAMRRTGAARAALRLDGEELELIWLKLDGAPADHHTDEAGLVVPDVPDAFVLETRVRLCPQDNTRLSGLYKSGGNFCTQCEAEGFRRITYFLDRPDVLTRFTVRIEADKAHYPVLLSNGNLIDSGAGEAGSHWAVWHDPFPKPSYLFALVAGDLAVLEDRFVTASGRDVALRLYALKGDIGKCDHAMASLKAAMAWDEEVYGLEYDLDIFNIVAVPDFNMGAMENKSLNIFNTSCVLADPKTATDCDFAAVESVVAHEYFHNWTGNRVTCRDWFQLSLKEGLTVFRDQQFSADQGSAPVCRIADVRALRARQFLEDQSPMAHPVRPDSYIEINNFYTATVYEKGAEVIRMMHRLLGAQAFRRGMDLYFSRHDGEAVTCDDFVAAMEDASGVDLGQFRLWYSQAGTPVLDISGHYDAAAKTYRLEVIQSCPPSAGQPTKKTMHIPLALGLLDSSGRDMVLRLAGEEGEGATTRVLDITARRQSFCFIDVPEAPTPSLLRGFSAPVRINADLTRADLAFLMGHDADPFTRWEAGQSLAGEIILDLLGRPEADFTLDEGFAAAFGQTLGDDRLDKAFVALALTLPDEEVLGQKMALIDVDGLHGARQFVMRALAERFFDALWRVYHANSTNQPYVFTPEAVGRRSLKNLALAYLVRGGRDEAIDLAASQFAAADNMTDSLAALACLAQTDSPQREAALAEFYDCWQGEPLVVDKWFSVQATADRPDTLAEVRRLIDHPAFEITNPNKVRALIGAFAMANPARFHAADGAGYRLLADFILRLDARNPQVAARLTGPLGRWRRYDPARQALMKQALERILGAPELSRDVYEIAAKSLD